MDANHQMDKQQLSITGSILCRPQKETIDLRLMTLENNSSHTSNTEVRMCDRTRKCPQGHADQRCQGTGRK